MERAVVLIPVLLVASLVPSRTAPPTELCAPSTAPARLELPPGDEKVLKALDAWLKAYRAGKIDFKSKRDLGKDSIAEKFGVMPKGLVGAFTAARELDVLLEQIVALQTPAAADAVLAIASIGLDGKVAFKAEMCPAAVRQAGEKAASKFTAPAVLDHVLKIARGEAKTDKALGSGVRAAALRQLGARRDATARELLEEQLKATDVPLRLAAVEALAQLADERSGEPLAAILATETNDVIVGAVADALRACYGKYLMATAGAAAGKDKGKTSDADRPSEAPGAGSDKPSDKPSDKAPDKTPGDGGEKPAGTPGEESGGKGADKPAGEGDKPADASTKDPGQPGDKPAKPAAGIPSPGAQPAAPPPQPESVQQSLRAVTAAIGRTHWRADLRLIDVVREFRSLAAVPVLIDVLQRFKDHPEQVQSGALSSLLLHRAHETLVALTGAVLPADAPQKWREFWEQEQQKLIAAPPPPKAKLKGTTGDTFAFCGIPVEGSRVLIIIDLSGSMEFAMPLRPGDTEAKGGKIHTSRLAFAKVQLAKLVNELPEWSKFNFITFNGRKEAESWQKDLVQAAAKNKDRAQTYIKDLVATYKIPTDGGTNMWAGLEAGLQYLRTKSFVVGQRDEAAVDEIFVVSDGAPTVGEVIDPLEILTLVTEANRFAQVRINTIFITSPNDQNPKNTSLSTNDLMRRMAEENGGRFVEFSN